MKITKERLKQIIVEELQNVMGEMDMLPMDSEDEERVKIMINDEEYEFQMLPKDAKEVIDLSRSGQGPLRDRFKVVDNKDGFDFVIDTDNEEIESMILDRFKKTEDKLKNTYY
jgi:hypothetical protein